MAYDRAKWEALKRIADAVEKIDRKLGEPAWEKLNREEMERRERQVNDDKVRH